MRIVLRKGEADQRGHQSQVHQRTVLKKKKKRIQPPLQLCLLVLLPPPPNLRQMKIKNKNFSSKKEVKIMFV